MLENTKKYQADEAYIEKYREFVDVEAIKRKAEGLTNIRILHINSVAAGGGVAAILSRIIPIFKNLNIYTEWYVPDVNNQDFFKVTKKQHNMLQGIDNSILDDKEKELYWQVQEHVAGILENYIDDYDIVIVHDTQYAGIIQYLKNRGHAKWVYRCHIDTSNPNPDVYNFFLPVISMYNSTIYHLDSFVLEGSPYPQILLPSIDPFDLKNDPRAVTEDYIKRTVEEMGLDYARPILLQVGRFDPAKGFEKMCDIFKSLKREYPELQLLLTGAGAKDDPEFYEYINKIRSLVKGYRDAVVKELPFDPLKLNAVQQAGSIVYAMSSREGFGLVISEASIKEKPVIVTNVGGLKVQVVNGKTGYIVNELEEAVLYTRNLLHSPDLRKRMGVEGRKYILSKFITPIHVSNYIDIFKNVLSL